MRPAIVSVLALALTSACIEQKEEPKPAAPAAPEPAVPAEPARSTRPLSVAAEYTIVAAAANKCLQYAAGAPDAAKAQIKTCDGSKAQLFNLRAVPGGYYEVLNVQTKSCLDLPAFSRAEGASAQQWPCNGGANQQWIVADADAATFRLIARHSGKALSVEEGKVADGALVVQATWKSGPNQQFKLQTLDSTGPDGGAGGKGGSSGGKSGKTGKMKKSSKASPPAAQP